MSNVPDLWRRIYQLEKVIEMLARACQCDNPDDRNQLIQEALSEMPQ